MKLQKPSKGLSDIRATGEKNRLYRKHKEQPRINAAKKQAQMEADARAIIERMQRQADEREIAATTSPLTAHEAGVGYRGPDMPDKGKKDGSCNVTACQMPLAGKPQFYMKDFGRRNYYCASCERKMSEWDDHCVRTKQQEPNGWNGALNNYGRRCWPDEDNGNL